MSTILFRPSNPSLGLYLGAGGPQVVTLTEPTDVPLDAVTIDGTPETALTLDGTAETIIVIGD